MVVASHIVVQGELLPAYRKIGRFRVFPFNGVVSVGVQTAWVEKLKWLSVCRGESGVTT